MTLGEANAYSDAVNAAVAAMENLQDVINRQRATIDLQYTDIGKLTRKVAERGAALAAVREELARDESACVRSNEYGRLHGAISEALGKFATEGVE